MRKLNGRNNTVRRYLWKYEVHRSRAALISSDGISDYDTRQLSDAAAVADTFRAVVGDPPREHFLAFYLNAANRIMGYETIAIGGCTSVEVEPAQVFRGALLAGAVRLIVAHNHPSGDPSPSASDVTLTRKLLDAASLIGVPLLDHVVVTAEGAHSLAASGSL